MLIVKTKTGERLEFDQCALRTIGDICQIGREEEAIETGTRTTGWLWWKKTENYERATTKFNPIGLVARESLEWARQTPAQAMEARRAETQGGSVHDSAVRQDAPTPDQGTPNHD